MNNHQLLAIVVVAIWLSVAIGSIGKKDSEAFGAAAAITFFIGVGYFLIRYNRI